MSDGDGGPTGVELGEILGPKFLNVVLCTNLMNKFDLGIITIFVSFICVAARPLE